jgi:endo-1,4-beta-xylanase
MIGTAVAPRDLSGERFDFVKNHFNAITAENLMKPMYLQPKRGEFDFEATDKIVSTAADNGFAMIGHTLAWHNQSPEWLNAESVSREEAVENLKNHIHTIAARYKGRIEAWDVVNEVFPNSVGAEYLNETHNWRGHLRQTPWLRAIGADFIEIAYRSAHEADPEATLIYNDFNLNEPPKREAAYHMVKELREKGVPIHMAGMQGHYGTNTDINEVRDSIRRFAELGVKVSITELDVTVQEAMGAEKLTEAQELEQAVHYAKLFKIFKENSGIIKRVTFWGLDDGTSWRGNRFPLLFNRDLSPKSAYSAVINPEEFLKEHE